MNPRQLLAALAPAAVTAIVLVACGGGSSNSANNAAMSNPSQLPPPPPPPPAGANNASGVISAFGSVFVGGTEYRTDTGTGIIDGDADDAAGTSAALLVGMNVDIDADANLMAQ